MVLAGDELDALPDLGPHGDTLYARVSALYWCYTTADAPRWLNLSAENALTEPPSIERSPS